MKIDKATAALPHFAKGMVIKGFGRGSKELGIPTANFPESVIEELPKDLPTGVYYGWAQVDSGEIHKMVMSVGWNPFYQNKKKSMETHILHKFTSDFYNSTLSVIMTGYIREEKDYESLDALVADINNDIATATKILDEEHSQDFKNSSHFQ